MRRGGKWAPREPSSGARRRTASFMLLRETEACESAMLGALEATAAGAVRGRPCDAAACPACCPAQPAAASSPCADPSCTNGAALCCLCSGAAGEGGDPATTSWVTERTRVSSPSPDPPIAPGASQGSACLRPTSLTHSRHHVLTTGSLLLLHLLLMLLVIAAVVLLVLAKCTWLFAPRR